MTGIVVVKQELSVRLADVKAFAAQLNVKYDFEDEVGTIASIVVELQKQYKELRSIYSIDEFTEWKRDTRPLLQWYVSHQDYFKKILGPDHLNNCKETKTMEKAAKVTISLSDVIERMESIDVRLAAIQQHLTGGASAGAKAKAEATETSGKQKMSKDEKDAVKAKLLKGAPYTKEQLQEKLNGRQVKMLAGAMGVNSFGKGRDEVTKMILAAQKKGTANPKGKASTAGKGKTPIKKKATKR